MAANHPHKHDRWTERRGTDPLACLEGNHTDVAENRNRILIKLLGRGDHIQTLAGFAYPIRLCPFQLVTTNLKTYGID